MAKAQIILGEGSGGINVTLDTISFTGKTLLGSITTKGGTYTATEDCLMGGVLTSTGSVQAFVAFNGSTVFSVGDNKSARIGRSTTSVSSNDTYGMFVPKGTVVTTRTDEGTPNLTFYSLD